MDNRRNPGAKRKLVRVAPDLTVWSPIVRTLKWLDTEVKLTVEATPSTQIQPGGFVCRRVEVTPLEGPLTGEMLRSIPIARLVNKIGIAEALDTTVSEDGSLGLEPFVLTAKDVKACRERGPTLETLKLVSAVYRRAMLVGDPPTKSVEANFDLPRSTAERWVAAARRAGVLGESAHGRAGG